MTDTNLGKSSIGRTAHVSSKAKLGEGCTIGEFTIIHENVILGKKSIVGSHCILGHPTPLADAVPLEIGPSALIRSHSVFYEGSKFGPELVTGHRVTVREKLAVGVNLQIGTLSDLQGHSVIGDYVRLHSNVFLAQHAKIGDFVWMFPHVVTTDDPHPPSDTRRGVVIGSYAAIGAHSTLLPGTNIGDGALVAAHSLVSRDIPSNMLVKGVPAKMMGPTSQVVNLDDNKPAYPWTRHFKRGYPPEIVAEWDE